MIRILAIWLGRTCRPEGNCPTKQIRVIKKQKTKKRATRRSCEGSVTVLKRDFF